MNCFEIVNTFFVYLMIRISLFKLHYISQTTYLMIRISLIRLHYISNTTYLMIRIALFKLHCIMVHYNLSEGWLISSTSWRDLAALVSIPSSLLMCSIWFLQIKVGRVDHDLFEQWLHIKGPPCPKNFLFLLPLSDNTIENLFIFG